MVIPMPANVPPMLVSGGNFVCHECGDPKGPWYSRGGKFRCVRCDNQFILKDIYRKTMLIGLCWILFATAGIAALVLTMFNMR